MCGALCRAAGLRVFECCLKFHTGIAGVFGGFAVALVGQAVWRHINKITSEWPTLDRSTLAEVFVFCLGYSVWVNSFFIALKYASVRDTRQAIKYGVKEVKSHVLWQQVLDVYLFNQSHVIYVLLFRIIACKRLPWQQYAALVVIGGGLYLSLSGNSSPLGIAIAAGGGAFAVPYIANAAPLQKKFGLVPVILMSQLSVLLVSVGVDGVGLLVGAEAQISWSRPFNPVNGFFGWTTAAQDHIWIWAYLVVVCGFMGMAAYTYAATKLPSLIIHAVMLVEPGMASVESTLMHTGLEPGLETWVGMAVITLGCCVVMIMDDAHHGHQADPDDHRGPAKAPKLVGVDGGEAVSEQHSLLRADSEAVYGSFDSSTPSERDSTVSPV